MISISVMIPPADYQTGSRWEIGKTDNETNTAGRCQKSSFAAFLNPACISKYMSTYNNSNKLYNPSKRVLELRSYDMHIPLILSDVLKYVGVHLKELKAGIFCLFRLAHAERIKIDVWYFHVPIDLVMRYELRKQICIRHEFYYRIDFFTFFIFLF